MSFRLSPKVSVKEILFITLSNIGDVVLTMPVFDVLRERFPSANISVITGPKAVSFFDKNPEVSKTFVYDKHLSWGAKWRWFLSLRQHRFDLVVDLRHCILPYVLQARVVPAPWSRPPLCHMREKHLAHLRTILGDVLPVHHQYGVLLSLQDEQTAEKLVEGKAGYVLMAPGAADDKKRWSETGFAQMAFFLTRKKGQKLVLVGNAQDRSVAERVLEGISPEMAVNLCGQTSLPELAAIVKRARGALLNDSGVMHLCSYFNIPVVALFGPTDPALYGPWSRRSTVVQGQGSMSSISVQEVTAAIEGILK